MDCYELSTEKKKQILKYENALIGVSEDRYDEDKQVVMSIYKSLVNENNDIPTFTQILECVLSYNYYNVYKASEIYYNECFLQDFKISSRNVGLNKQETENSIQVQIDSIATDNINDINFCHTMDICDLIKDTLKEAGYEYEDDDIRNPLLSDIMFDYPAHKIIANNAQLVFSHELFAEEYSNGNLLLQDDLSHGDFNMRIEKRAETNIGLGDRLISQCGNIMETLKVIQGGDILQDE